MTRLAAAVLSLVLATRARAHIALWDKGLFGINWPGQITDAQQNYDNSYPVQPLEKSHNLTEEEWFAHGYKSYPPKDGDFMILPSGGSYTGELSCNRAWTTLGDPSKPASERLIYFACPDKGSVHISINYTDNPSPPTDYFGGTALAIAYTSDVDNLQPGDLTVFSVNYTSVWARETVYQVPKGMPPCPTGGCLCTWNWFHLANHGEGNPWEIYNNLYRCNVTGETDDTKVVAPGQVPKKCDTDQSQCVSGAKVPMYLWQVSGNNLPDDGNLPTYTTRYGFNEGAQTDILVAAPANASASSSTTSAGQSSSASSPAASSAAPSSAARRNIRVPFVLTALLRLTTSLA